MSLPTFSQWKHLLNILSRTEIVALASLAAIAVISAFVFIGAAYQNHTIAIPDDKGTYTEGVIGSPHFLNPVYSDLYNADRDITQLLFTGLLAYDSNNQIVPGLANYKISDDAKTYEFTIKDGLHWSDATPITADDAIYTIKIIQDPAYKSPLRPNWIGVETEKISSTSFRLKLKDPSAIFLDYCTLKIIPQHIWEKITPESFPLSSYNLEPVTYGPYQFQKANISKTGTVTSINLIKNPDYFGKKTQLEHVTFAFFPDDNSLTAAFKRGSIQGYVPSENPLVNNIDGTNTYSYSLPRYYAIFLNPATNKVLEDPQVRASLAWATDKQTILQDILKDQGTIVNSPILPERYGIQNPDSIISYDPQKAGEILDTAGYKISANGLRAKSNHRQPAFQFSRTLLSGSTITSDVKELQKCLIKEVAPDLQANGNFGSQTVEAVKKFQEKYRSYILDPQNITQPNGEVKQATREKLNEVCFPSGDETASLQITLTIADQAPFTAVAQIIKSQWAKIGVTVNINAVAPSSLERDIIKPRAYEALLYGQALGSIPDPFPYWHSSYKNDPGLNFSLYENKDADKLMEEIRQTVDANSRNEKLKLLQDIIVKDTPAILLYNPNYSFITSKEVQNIRSGNIITPGQRFNNIADWYTATKRIWK